MTSFEPARMRHGPRSAVLTVAATLEHLGVLRALVRTAAAQYPLSVNALTDLVLAADEAASTLVERARPGSALTCTVGVDTDECLLVAVTAEVDCEIAASKMSLGRIVLAVLVDDADLKQAPSANGNWTATITLSKALHGRS